MERYSEYKDSGVQWLGEIPSHWRIERIAIHFDENKNKNNKFEFSHALKFNYGKLVPKKESGEISEYKKTYESYTIISKNDIAINGLNLNYDLVSQRVAISPYRGILTSAYLIITPKRTVYPFYCNYYFKAMDNKKMFQGLGTGIRLTLSYSEIKKQLIILPPISEQQAIAGYLDKITTEIDKAIEQQQKMIDLLNERKQIIISDAVAKGLDKNVNMKDSAVEWIGEIPIHWKINPLKTLLLKPLMYGANEPAEFFNEKEPRYIRITDIDENGCLREDNCRSLSIEKSKKYLLNQGDVLFARSGATVGKTYLFNELYTACFAGYLIKATCDRKKILPSYLIKYTQSRIYNNWKNGISVQATIQNIGADKYSFLPVIVPPISEQQVIATYLDKKCEEIDKAIDQQKRMIDLLQERKKIIINNAVTGKVKVS